MKSEAETEKYFEDCYNELPNHIKWGAVKFLQEQLLKEKEVVDEIKKAYQKHGKHHWIHDENFGHLNETKAFYASNNIQMSASLGETFCKLDNKVNNISNLSES